MPMERLDNLVLGALKERLFAPDRLEILLRSLSEREALCSVDVAGRLVALQAAADDIKTRLTRFYKAIENGVAEEDEILKDRIVVLKTEQAQAVAALNRAKLESAPSIVIDAERIARFGILMRDRMDNADVNAKRAYIGSVVTRIEIHDDKIKIVGQKDTLQNAVQRGADQTQNVRGFVRNWRARRDSNS